jgi:hypothetical protein
VVTCDDPVWWIVWGLDDRKVYVNGAEKTSAIGSMPLPAKGNSGYAFYFTSSASQIYTGLTWGGGTANSCP